MLAKHSWIPRGELYSVWISGGASAVVDSKNPPDECYWPAHIPDNGSRSEEARTMALHGRQNDLYAYLQDLLERLHW